MSLTYLSPLRYPGGKGRLGSFIGGLIARTLPRRRLYVEPFAGGAGAALRLLVDEHVEAIHLNDINPGVAAFWRCVFERTAELSILVRRATVTVREWHRHREVYLAPRGDELALAFATFYLNRTNRSGILHARPIGGLEQRGRWRIGARFNREDLADRVEFLGSYRDRVKVTCEDARRLVGRLRPCWDDCFIYADPPYLVHGGKLYTDAMKWSDHVALADLLGENESPWMVTYDVDPRVVSELYPDQRCAIFGIAHTAARQQLGEEYAVFSDGVRVPEMSGVGSGEARWIRQRRRPLD